MIKIHFAYRHIEKPWGGANNFIRALHRNLFESERFIFTSIIEEECDVLFMNQLGTGPGGNGKPISLAKVKGLLTTNGNNSQRRKLVVRAVNLNWHAFPLGPKNLTIGWWRDHQTLALLNMADMVIFQSAYQHSFFEQAGYKGNAYTIIHNGADSSFGVENPAYRTPEKTLKLISSSASPRTSKRHDLIARLSLIDGIEVSHLGAWPDKLDRAKVNLLGLKSKDEMIKILTQYDYFIHPAIKDPCPNSVFEALYAGLPVIYNPAPGSSAEIVGNCGLGLNEANLVETIEKARSNLSTYRQEIMKNRQRFGIEFAASKYQNLFEEIVKH